MNHEPCRYCGFPKANGHDYDTIPEDEGQHLCWIDYSDCLVSAEDAVDAKNKQIAELETQLALAKDEIKLLRKTPLRQKCQKLERDVEHWCDMHAVAANQRDKLSTITGELIAMIRVNAQRGAWTALADHEIDRHLAPWIKRLAAITQTTGKDWQP